MAVKRLPNEYKKYYLTAVPANVAKPGAAPAASPAASSAAASPVPQLNKYQLGVGQRQYTADDMEALRFVKENPNDPRAAIIKQRLALGK
jgi:hypothetical protein